MLILGAKNYTPVFPEYLSFFNQMKGIQCMIIHRFDSKVELGTRVGDERQRKVVFLEAIVRNRGRLSYVYS